MIVEEILRTCSNVNVAGAALASIGGDLAENLAAKASNANLSPGVLVSLIVKAFSEQASFDQRCDVWRAAYGADQPVLSGLRHILSRNQAASQG